MVKFKVPLKDILGNGYYQCELTTSDYNPNIGFVITITATVKNTLGNPVADKELVLLQNGFEQGTATTNANGIATWDVTCTDWGNQHFNVGNATLDLMVTGWKQVAQKTVSGVTYTCRVNGQGIGKIIITSSNTSFATGNTHEATGWIPSQYQPTYNISMSLVNRSVSNNIIIYVWGSGTIGVTNTYSSTQTASLNTQLIYSYI